MFKVFTTVQPAYLNSQISIHPPHRTCFSSIVTLSLLTLAIVSISKIANSSFLWASPYLENRLTNSFRHPNPVQSACHSPHLCFLSLQSSPFSPPITPSLVLFRLKYYLFQKSFPPWSRLLLPTGLTCTDFLTFFFFFFFFVLVFLASLFVSGHVG